MSFPNEYDNDVVTEAVALVDINAQWDLISVGAVKLNPDPAAGARPYLPPTMCLGMDLTAFTYTWPGTPEVGASFVVTASADPSSEIYVGCRICRKPVLADSLDDGEQGTAVGNGILDPWYLVTAISGTTVTCQNLELREVDPLGAGAVAETTQILLQGSDVKIGTMDSGIPLIYNRDGLANNFKRRPSTNRFGLGTPFFSGFRLFTNVWVTDQSVDTGSTTTVITLTPGGLTVNALVGATAILNPSIVTGNRDGVIVSNTATSITLAAALPLAPSSGENIEINGDCLPKGVVPFATPVDNGTPNVATGAYSELGGWVGKNFAPRATSPAFVTNAVWDGRVGSIRVHAGYFLGNLAADAEPETLGTDIVWPAAPVTGGGTLTLSAPATAAILRFKFRPSGTNGPFAQNTDIVRLDKEPHNWFKVIGASTGAGTIDIDVGPLQTTPTYTALDTSSRSFKARIQTLAPHAKNIAYTYNFGVTDLCVLVDIVAEAIADDVDIFYENFWRGYLDAALDVDKPAALVIINGLLQDLEDANIMTISQETQYVNNIDYTYPSSIDGTPLLGSRDVGPITFHMSQTGPRDFDNEDPNLSDFEPDEANPTPAAAKNLHRLTSVTRWNGFRSTLEFNVSGARAKHRWDLSVPGGSFDLRYPDKPAVNNLLFGACGGSTIHWRNGTNSTSRKLEYGNVCGWSGMNLSGCCVANTIPYFAILIQAYKRAHGARPTIKKLKSLVKRSVWRRTGPRTDSEIRVNQLKNVSSGKLLFVTGTGFDQVNTPGFPPACVLPTDLLNADNTSIGGGASGEVDLLVGFLPDRVAYGAYEVREYRYDEAMRMDIIGRGHLNLKKGIAKAVSDSDVNTSPLL